LTFVGRINAAAYDRPIALAAPADRYRAYRTVGSALAVILLCLIGMELVRNALAPTDRDFISFWAAAKLALSGAPAAAYDNEALRALQTQFVAFRSAAEMPFPYPPAFLIPLLPFSLLPFAAGMASWSLLTLAAWLLVIRRMFPDSGWLALAFPPVYASAAIGQNGCITAAVLGGALLLLPRRPFAAGLLLGCLVLKPQLALLVPVALLAGREWRAFAGAAVSAPAILLLGLVVFGPDTSRAWLGQMPLYAEIARSGLVGWHKLASVYAALRQLGVPATPAFIVHGAVAVAAAGVVWRVWRSDCERLAKASVLAAATMLVSPYLFFYDAVILTLPLFFLAEHKTPAPLVGALWLAPAVAVFGAVNAVPLNVSAMVAMALLLLVWKHVRSPRAHGDSEPHLR
jgi:hypothetical protein